MDPGLLFRSGASELCSSSSNNNIPTSERIRKGKGEGQSSLRSKLIRAHNSEPAMIQSLSPSCSWSHVSLPRPQPTEREGTLWEPFSDHRVSRTLVCCTATKGRTTSRSGLCRCGGTQLVHKEDTLSLVIDGR